MRATGNIRKMKSNLGELVEYTLPLYNVLEPKDEIPLNQFVGKNISLRFENEINCVITGQKIKKTLIFFALLNLSPRCEDFGINGLVLPVYR